MQMTEDIQEIACNDAMAGTVVNCCAGEDYARHKKTARDFHV